MNEIIKDVSRSFASRVGKIFPYHEEGLKSLVYHSISEDGDRFSVTPENFRKQMKILLKLKPVVNFHEAEKFKTAFAVTFDDGYKDFLSLIEFFELQKLPVMLFITRDFIENPGNKYLNRSDVQSLENHKYVTLGCHGCTHTDLADLAQEKMTAELTNSKKWLEDLIGKKVDSMALPFGGESKAVLDTAFSEGFEYVATSRLGVTLPSHRVFYRTCILKSDTDLLFQTKLKPIWDKRAWLP